MRMCLMMVCRANIPMCLRDAKNVVKIAKCVHIVATCEVSVCVTVFELIAQTLIVYHMSVKCDRVSTTVQCSYVRSTQFRLCAHMHRLLRNEEICVSFCCCVDVDVFEAS